MRDSRAVLGLAVAAMLSLSSLTGCGTGVSGAFGTGEPVRLALRLEGSVHGGQQPIAGASIQLYTVGTTGLKSASTALIASPPMTTAAGNFTIDGTYNCNNATEVYIVATGGNSGSGGNNSAISLMAALGSCATLQANAATTFISINELTTVAGAYALAPFAQNTAHIGAAGSNPVGLLNAFATAGTLADTSTGHVPGTALPAGAVVPVVALNTLGNILAACVNTSSATSPACGTLFSATGGADTLQAALAIAKNPGASAVTALYSLPNGQAPFQPSLAAQPKDFTLAVSYNAGGGLSAPYGIAIDAAGDAWITNEAGVSVTELSPTGAPVTTATAANLFGPQGIAIDRNGNVWVANTAGNSVIRYGVTAGAISSTDSYTPAGMAGPTGIALDSQGNAYVAALNSSAVYGLTNAGAALAGSPYTGGNRLPQPSGVAVDAAGKIYATTGTGAVLQFASDGSSASTITDGMLTGSLGVATTGGNLLVAGSNTGSAVGGAVSNVPPAGGGQGFSAVQVPAATAFGVATDGTSAWVANSGAAGSLSEVPLGAGTPASPALALGSLNTPVGVAVDGSGNVWTTNMGSNSVSKFVGLGVPVVTPLAMLAGP